MKKKLILLGLPSLACAAAHAQVSISIQSSNLSMIPGSTRSLYATVSGTTNTTVNWSVAGGTISSSQTTGAPLVVTAPNTGASCAVIAGAADTSFTSSVNVVVTATAAADSTATASRSIPVCNPSVMLTTFPMTKIRYRNQYAVIQSDLRGSVNTAVQWTITTNPNNAGSIVGGTTNRHAIFTATTAGTYVLTATSVADGTKTASSTIIVTPNLMPSTPNSDHTQPFDCSGYTAPGTTYEVGPLHAYADLNAVPWTAVTYGDMVRIHNDDTTGTNPTDYQQYVFLPGPTTGQTGTVNPIVVCGVPDASGNKPVIDGNNAKVRPDANTAAGNLYYGLFTTYDGAHKVDQVQDQLHNVIIAGLKFINADVNHSYYQQGASSTTPWTFFTACIRTNGSWQTDIEGNDLGNCDQDIFINSVTPLGEMAQDMTVEGNYLHGWGSTNQGSHSAYLQSIGLQTQFNYFGASASNAIGNLLKTRSVLEFTRWNYFSLLAVNARAMDMVEPQAFGCYVTPYEFGVVYMGNQKTDCYTPNYAAASSDTTSADYVSANFEAYHSDYVYGNVIQDAGSGSAVAHYGYDQSIPMNSDRHAGRLYYYSNTFLGSGSSKGAFDLVAPDSPYSAEYPTVLSLNSIWGGATSFYVTGNYWPAITTDTSWMTAVSLPTRGANDQYQGGTPSNVTNCNQYLQCDPNNGHLLWARQGVFGSQASTLYTGAAPVSTVNYTPTSAASGLMASLPAAIADQPSNMAYYPATNTVQPRTANFLGALDGQPVTVSSIAITPASSTIAYNGSQIYTCTTTLSDGSTRSCTSPTLSSSNTQIATVSGLTVTSATTTGGTVTITATAEGYTTTATLTVSAQPPLLLPVFGNAGMFGRP